MLRPIPNQSDYFCDQQGRIYSSKSGRIKELSAFVRGRQGHLGVNLSQNGKYVMWSVHTLVALTWIGPKPSSDHIVMHADDDPSHNADSNLSWGLPAENSAQMAIRGRASRGEIHHKTKLTADDVRSLRSRIAAGERGSAVARAFNISHTGVNDIVNRRTWKHIN